MTNVSTIPNKNLEIKSPLGGLVLFRSIFNFSRQKSRHCRIFISISKKLSQYKNVNELYSATSYLHTNVFMQVLAFHCFDRDSVQAKIF